MYKSSFMLMSKTYILSVKLNLKLTRRYFWGDSGVAVDKLWNEA